VPRHCTQSVAAGQVRSVRISSVRLSDFDYTLPSELIAQRPPAARGDARLLCVDCGGGGAHVDRAITQLPELLTRHDLVVLNDTRVLPARLFGRKSTGGKVELLLERALDNVRGLVQARANKPLRPGTSIVVDGGGELTIVGRQGPLFEVSSAGEPLLTLFERAGHVPLPPYIERPAEPSDAARYQTVWAREPGAVAAPTAGLHFDEELLADLSSQGVQIAHLTLHVGAGTFLPAREDILEKNRLHSERMVLSPALCAAIRHTRSMGGRVVAVGTTVARALETAALKAGGSAPEPFEGETTLFIKPGFQFRVVDALLTNFHVPRSTLLMLVAAFAGHAIIMDAYRYAIRQRYRFYSFGDAMWLCKPGKS